MKQLKFIKYFEINKNDIYLIPTIRIAINEARYINNYIAVEFHFLIFHARLLCFQGGD